MKSEVKCRECGWQGEWSEVGRKTIHGEWWDVSRPVCPSCHRVDYEGRNMLVEVGMEPSK